MQGLERFGGSGYAENGSGVQQKSHSALSVSQMTSSNQLPSALGAIGVVGIGVGVYLGSPIYFLGMVITFGAVILSPIKESTSTIFGIEDYRSSPQEPSNTMSTNRRTGTTHSVDRAFTNTLLPGESLRSLTAEETAAKLALALQRIEELDC